MTVFGFVGPSGTGKSYRALEVARRHNVSCILDDGLLIRDNKVLAGTSAKREASRIASVRRALYTEKNHAEEVRLAIGAADAESVMILGTSVHMVDSIALRLGLPPISTYIDISDVATQGEMEAARVIRTEEGKHVIPAPTFALKKDFPGYFLTPLLRLVNLGQKTAKSVIEGPNAGMRGSPGPYTADLGERTVVRPTFSYLGEYTISRAALEQLVSCIAIKCAGVTKITDAGVDYTDGGLVIDVAVCVKYGAKIHNVLNAAVKSLRTEVDRQTALHIRGVRLTAKSLETD